MTTLPAAPAPVQSLQQQFLEFQRRKHARDLFEAKPVVNLDCRACRKPLCTRGMSAVLLGDKSTQLFSADMPSLYALGVVGKSYTANSCACRISDTACLAWFALLSKKEEKNDFFVCV